MKNATKTANNRKKMKKIFVLSEKVSTFAVDCGMSDGKILQGENDGTMG
jgi:hypothetical protein